MADNDSPPNDHQRQRTAFHEAGHAVLHHVLTLGVKHVTIVPDYEELTNGTAAHGGEFPQDEDAEALRNWGEEAFWLRHAAALYAGAEAVKRSGLDPENWQEGADRDFREAIDALLRITGDDDSLAALDACARRRSELLVDHYWPEIEAVAKALVAASELSGESVRRLFMKSFLAREAGMAKW